jgi:hypothetical protein
MPRNVSAETLAAHPLRIHTPMPRARRRNLVFFRCGRNSVHYGLYPLPAERNWDCMLSFYEDHQPEDLVQAEYVLSGSLSKWHGFAQARFETPELRLDEYEYVFLVDDDVRPGAVGDIDRLFDIAREQQFAVCQPSLSASSHAFWEITRHHPSWHVRYTTFVECMAPVFSAAAIEALRDDLCAAVSGCGLDLIIHTALADRHGRLGVIDAVVVAHEKPVDMVNGAFYRMLHSIGVDHDEEIAYFLNRYGIRGINAANLGGVSRVQQFYPIPEAGAG